jgi:hypothetical protein
MYRFTYRTIKHTHIYNYIYICTCVFKQLRKSCLMGASRGHDQASSCCTCLKHLLCLMCSMMPIGAAWCVCVLCDLSPSGCCLTCKVLHDILHMLGQMYDTMRCWLEFYSLTDLHSHLLPCMGTLSHRLEHMGDAFPHTYLCGNASPHKSNKQTSR